MIRLYNTLSRKKDASQTSSTKNGSGSTPAAPPSITTHISAISAPIFLRMSSSARLNTTGYEVRRVMNVTDVGHLTGDADEGEDKLDKRGGRKKRNRRRRSRSSTPTPFSRTLQKLNIKKPDIIAPATNSSANRSPSLKRSLKKALPTIRPPPSILTFAN